MNQVGHPISKMTDKKVRALRRMVSDGVAIKNAAEDFGISYSYASRIIRGVQRRNVSMVVPTRYVYAGKGQPPTISVEETIE